MIETIKGYKWENVRLCYTLFRIKLKFKSWFSWLGLDFWWLDVGFFLLLLMNSFPFRDLPLPTGYRDIEDGCETSSMGKRQGVRWMFRCVIEISSSEGIEPGFFPGVFGDVDTWRHENGKPVTIFGKWGWVVATLNPFELVKTSAC